MKKRPQVTRARLRKLLHYDRDTGEFRWLKRVTNSVRIGEIAGALNKDGYRRITVNGRSYMAHHLAWLYVKGQWCRRMIDHKDGNPSNNRWTNLRSATLSQSSANRRPSRNNSCGFKGVWRNGSGWCATINKDRRRHYLGIFPTPQKAHAAYVMAARELFGEFARTE